ncbi:MAG: hypothetical protein JW967_10580 [Dehalococcoidales bacterium]|nr:hypothetical protein [Dehalococcoidales bacterium]
MTQKKKKEFRVIELGGTPYEIGYQYGKASIEIRDYLEVTCKELGLQRTDIAPLMQKYLPWVEKFDPEIVEIIKGFANGAKVSLDEAYLTNYSFEVSTVAHLKPFAGCTSFIATGEATLTGETLIGQTVDLFPEAEEGVRLLKIKPQKGSAFLGLAPNIGCLPNFNLNSAGIGLDVNALVNKHSIVNHNGVSASMLHYKMSCSDNITKALGIYCTAVKSFNTTPLVGLCLANKEGSAVYCEAIPGDYNILYPEKGILTHANHFETERFQSGEMAHVQVPDSFFRARRLRELMHKNHGKLTVDLMKELLADHVNFPYSVCRHFSESDPPDNRVKSCAAIISQPAELKMHITWGNPCENEFVEYKL